jgi:reverse gyrase
LVAYNLRSNAYGRSCATGLGKTTFDLVVSLAAAQKAYIRDSAETFILDLT